MPRVARSSAGSLKLKEIHVPSGLRAKELIVYEVLSVRRRLTIIIHPQRAEVKKNRDTHNGIKVAASPV
jgi:hypothetical protein